MKESIVQIDKERLNTFFRQYSVESPILERVGGHISFFPRHLIFNKRKAKKEVGQIAADFVQKLFSIKEVKHVFLFSPRENVTEIDVLIKTGSTWEEVEPRITDFIKKAVEKTNPQKEGKLNERKV